MFSDSSLGKWLKLGRIMEQTLSDMLGNNPTGHFLVSGNYTAFHLKFIFYEIFVNLESLLSHSRILSWHTPDTDMEKFFI